MISPAFRPKLAGCRYCITPIARIGLAPSPDAPLLGQALARARRGHRPCLLSRQIGFFLLMRRITTMSHTAYLSMSLIQKGWAADILVPWGATGVCERARRGSWFLRVRGSRV